MADWESHAKSVRLYEKIGSKALAAKAAIQWTNEFPDDPEALRTAAGIASGAGRPETGSLFLRAYDANPGDINTMVGTLMWLADHHVHLHRLDAILADLKHWIEANPAAPPVVRHFCALGAARAGRPEIALEFIAGVEELAPTARLLGWLVEARRAVRDVLPAESDTVLFVSVWGEAYASTFVDLALAALMHDSNLPAFLRGRRAVLLVFCDEAARGVLESAPLFARLAGHVAVRYVDLPAGCLEGNPFVNVLGVTQHVGYHAAAHLRADALFLHADGVYSQGSFRYLTDRIAAGCEMFCTIAFSAVLEEIRPLLAAARGPDGTIGIAGRRLVGAAFRHMHERAKAMLVRADSKTRPSNAALLLFQESDRLRMRAFQPGPIWIARRLWQPDLRFNYCVSDNGVMNRIALSNAPPPRIEFGPDSDLFCLVDLAPAGPGSVRTTTAPVAGDLAAAIFESACQWNMVDAFRLRAFEAEAVMRGDDGVPWPEAPACDGVIAAIAGKARDFLATQDALIDAYARTAAAR